MIDDQWGDEPESEATETPRKKRRRRTTVKREPKSAPTPPVGSLRQTRDNGKRVSAELTAVGIAANARIADALLDAMRASDFSAREVADAVGTTADRIRGITRRDKSHELPSLSLLIRIAHEMGREVHLSFPRRRLNVE